eukprot:2713434-Amphidinium_carterae.2
MHGFPVVALHALNTSTALHDRIEAAMPNKSLITTLLTTHGPSGAKTMDGNLVGGNKVATTC